MGQAQKIRKIIHCKVPVFLNGSITDLIPDGDEQDVNEELVRLSRNVVSGVDDLVVFALHDELLKLDRILDIRVGQQDIRRQQLQLGMEVTKAILRKQTKQIETEELVHPRRFG